MLMLETYRG